MKDKGKNFIFIQILFVLIITTNIRDTHASLKRIEEAHKNNKEISRDILWEAINELMTFGYYYTSIPLFKSLLTDYPEKLGPQQDKFLERLITNVGREHFEDLPAEILIKSSSPYVIYIQAYSLYQANNFPESYKLLSQIPKSHPVFPQALYLTGSMLEFEKDYRKSITTYRSCMEIAGKFASRFRDIYHLQKTYQYIQDSCHISIGRGFYKSEKFDLAKKFYESIEIKSFQWPYMLLEDAWANYQLGDYNRSIGRLLTTRAPLLKSYYFPETEILLAINYAMLCMWDDTVNSINRFENIFLPVGEKLIKLGTNKNVDPLLFFKLATGKKFAGLQNFDFLQDIIGQAKINPYYLRNIYYLEMATEDMNRLKSAKIPLRKYLFSQVQMTASHQASLINAYIKGLVYNKASGIMRANGDLELIKLDVFTHKKELLMAKKELEVGKGGDLRSVRLTDKQQFWDFRGEFWPDELGNYSLGLKSNCKKEGDKI